MRITEQITGQENHFNDLQTSYRKLASTWLLASFAACGYILKSSDLPYDEWYFVFGISMAASAGLSILWMMDLTVYQKLLSAYFLQGIILELDYYQWLIPSRINIVRSQRTGEVTSKMQYYYFFSIAILQLLAIISIWNFKVLSDSLAEKIIYSLIIGGGVLYVQWRLIGAAIRRRRDYKGKSAAGESGIWQLIKEWEEKTGATPMTGQ
jgi:hypothetical protein